MHDDTPSRDRCTSSSRPSAPSARPLSNAAIVFSGASALPPRCANTSGRRRLGRRRDGALLWESLSCVESIHGGHSDPRRAAAVGLPFAPGQAGNPRQSRPQAAERATPLFPGIIGYDETVIPQLVNAILSRHNFILLGLRGQAKSRILRGLVDLLDEQIPVVPGCEIHDDPLAPLCAACRARSSREGDDLPIGWLPRDDRYVEKLATPDVTIADMVGDIDPIKAAQARSQPLRRADDALRPAAAGQPRHLRDQRAARSRRQDPGRPVQHPAGRRRPD